MGKFQTTVPTADEASMLGVRPRARHDVMYAQTNRGVYLHCSDTQFALTGPTTYRLVSSILPYLDGRSTVAELCDGLTEANRTAVIRLLRTLIDRGFVRDQAAGQEPRLPRETLDEFAPLVNYVEHYVDDAANRFADFLDTRVLILGGSAIGPATAASLRRNGLPDANVRVVDPAGSGSLDGYDPRAFEVTVVTSDAAAVLPRIEAGDGPVVLPIMLVGRYAVLGPMVRPGAAPCWTCARLRLGANLPPELAADMWRESALPGLPASAATIEEPVGRMLGNALAFDVFRLRTGANPAETDGALLIQDLDTLETTRTPVHPHPACPRCGALAPPAAPAPDAAEDATEEERRQARQAPLFGRHAGVLHGYADDPLPQSPLRVGRVRFGAPARLENGARDITAFDLYTTLGARVRAFSAAALCYVDAVRTGHALPATPEPTTEPVPAGRLATRTGLPDDTAAGPWLPATSLVSGDERAVPAAAVYPYSELNGAMVVERTAAGGGCGETLAEARLAGLLSALTHRGLGAAAAGQQCGTIAVAQFEGGDGDATTGTAIAFLLRALGRFEGETALLDLPAAEPAHAVLARHAGTGAWATGSGLSRDAAVLAALRDLLGLLQLGAGDPGGAEGPDLGNVLLAGFDPRAVACAPAGPRPDTTEEGLVAGVRAAGHDALVVETTPMDLHGAGFRTVRVLFVP
ncbi:bacteriocin biosynthesis cyclodehydratase domain-containing protein [Lipingzhangella halophila]|uniref:Bacteriocin biosynthesis cyclodehydratase domain-containing protein n=1 Tax=Lipingzhangella halophila TaxID=1783352 RepID=A0A7W7W2H5_9ACTN|nr:TOMM precursor leader peptide-binding protein [Lipingzhangella halophila]MBB4931771.1 bacteriocin biosynthesis cyclodehydratase domain-containing protein [Lipingzhangella halophila]